MWHHIFFFVFPILPSGKHLQFATWQITILIGPNRSNIYFELDQWSVFHGFLYDRRLSSTHHVFGRRFPPGRQLLALHFLGAPRLRQDLHGRFQDQRAAHLVLLLIEGRLGSVNLRGYHWEKNTVTCWYLCMYMCIYIYTYIYICGEFM